MQVLTAKHMELLMVLIMSQQGVHCAGLSGVQEASRNMLSADALVSPSKRSLISESVSVAPSSVTEASFYCALIYVSMAHMRYNLQQSFHL
jgi:hypothetical protein